MVYSSAYLIVMKGEIMDKNIDEDIINLYNQGLSSKKVANILNISGSTVLSKLRKNNVPIRNQKEYE